MSLVWFYTLTSVIIVSLLSFAGALVLVLKQKSIKRILILLVSFAAGAMLGDVFLHMLPELAHMEILNLNTSLLILVGIVIFFVLEKVIHWRHCHLSACEDHIHPLAFMNLVGDAVHNFIDGILIAGSFMLSFPVGLATTIAVILHEIPQEMGDLGVLLHAGMKAKKALLFNFLSALTSVLGAVIVLLIGSKIDLTAYIIPITIGGFLYIANADLIPELHKETKIGQSIWQLVMLLVGAAIMFVLLLMPFHEQAHEATHEGHDHGNNVEHVDEE